jgi:hypothetical protein
MAPGSGRLTVTLLRPGGVRLSLDASWIVLAGLLYWSLDAVVMPFLTPEIDRQAYRFMAAAGVIGSLVLVVLREAVVAMVAGRRRLPLTEIRLLPVGGARPASRWAPPAPIGLRNELLLLVVGTATSALLAVGVLLAVFKLGGPQTPLAVSGTGFFLGLAGATQLAVGLLPLSPFGGGRALGAALAKWATTPAGALRVVQCIDLVAAATALAAGLWLVAGAGEQRHLGVWLIVAAALILAHGRPWRAADNRLG